MKRGKITIAILVLFVASGWGTSNAFAQKGKVVTLAENVTLDPYASLETTPIDVSSYRQISFLTRRTSAPNPDETITYRVYFLSERDGELEEPQESITTNGTCRIGKLNPNILLDETLGCVTPVLGPYLMLKILNYVPPPGFDTGPITFTIKAYLTK